MKKIILLAGLAVILLTGCERETIYEPFADFGVEYSLVIPREVIFFNNYSHDATSYEWDFGDGTFATVAAPSHYYTKEGLYRVTLRAFNHGRVDYAYLDIEVYETTLEVEVIEWRNDNIINYIPNVDITLYTSFLDWENFTNSVIDGETDVNGVVVFKGLQTLEYYIDAWNKFFTNELLAYETNPLGENIKTLPLQYAKHNVFTAYVDYAPTGATILKSTRMRVKEAKVGATRSLKDLTKVEDKK